MEAFHAIDSLAKAIAATGLLVLTCQRTYRKIKRGSENFRGHNHMYKTVHKGVTVFRTGKKIAVAVVTLSEKPQKAPVTWLQFGDDEALCIELQKAGLNPARISDALKQIRKKEAMDGFTLFIKRRIPWS
ncbi:MAG: hypothetical protein ACREBW_00710 [Candidatus Micrarchaeaceae archaeon]